MNLREETIEYLKEQKQIIESGGVNCIPSSFTRFRSDYPGVQRFYYIVTGATKASKTQLATYLFIIQPVLYWLEHPDQVSKPKIFYFNLEEAKRNIILRLYSHIVYRLSNGRLRVSPQDLKSIDERKPLSQEVLDLMETERFKTIADAFEDCIEFRDERNPTGMFVTVKDYMERNGRINYKEKDVIYTDELGQKHQETIVSFDRYVPNDSKKYVITITDHVGLISLEKGIVSLKDAIERHSINNVRLRNDYGVTPVLIQQQNSETTNLEAFKANKIRPTKDGLKESKRPGEDCTVLIGITNPFAFELPDYLKYNVTRLKDNFRIMEIVLNREGVAGGLCPLFFDGAVNNYIELPLPNNPEIEMAYQKSESLRNQRNTVFMALKKRLNILLFNRFKSKENYD